MPPSGKGFLVENQIMLMSDIAVVLCLCAFLTGFETGSCVAAFKKQKVFQRAFWLGSEGDVSDARNKRSAAMPRAFGQD